MLIGLLKYYIYIYKNILEDTAPLNKSNIYNIIHTYSNEIRSCTLKKIFYTFIDIFCMETTKAENVTAKNTWLSV